uniref:Transposable element Tcb2 transposase n=1 Tax=Salmo salar TaxID=8030 RepID=C0H9R8_SALSA|nr:Transposable element Tcb2 transposase [Salmo salar]
MLMAVWIWRKQHESMEPSCLVSTVQAGGGGVMVWGMFSWQTLGSLIAIDTSLYATAYLNMLAEDLASQLLANTRKKIKIANTRHR